jgi:hypothetical protein
VLFGGIIIRYGGVEFVVERADVEVFAIVVEADIPNFVSFVPADALEY